MRKWKGHAKELGYLRSRIPADSIQMLCVGCNFITPPSLSVSFSFRELTRISLRLISVTVFFLFVMDKSVFTISRYCL